MTRVMNLHTILQVILELFVKSPSVSQGSRVIIVVFTGRISESIYVAAVEALRKKGKIG